MSLNLTISCTLYRQVQGDGTGQKQAPPVACLGGREVEEEFLNLPGLRTVMSIWGRYIYDIFSLFSGDVEKCKEVFRLFDSLYPGQIKVTWEFSRTNIIFLNIEVFINREKQIIETKYCVCCVQHGSLGTNGEQQGGVEPFLPSGPKRKVPTAGIPITAYK